MKSRLVVLMALALAGATLLALFAPYREAHADTYRELKACLRHDIDTTEPKSSARALSLADCYAAWLDQKFSLNISIAPSSSGYGTGFVEGPRLIVPGLSAVTVDLDIFSSDPVERVDFYLLNDSHNPPEPNLGLLVGSDTDGFGAWSITFDPNVGGTDLWDGYVVAEAHFAGHDLENDGDVAAIYITRDPTAVGGTLGVLDEAESPADASGSSSGGDTALLAAAAVASAVALAAGGWYARRRWMR